MADVADALWGTGEAGLIDRVRELEGLLAGTTAQLECKERELADATDHATVLEAELATRPIPGELQTIEVATSPACSALDDAAIAIASRIVNGAADLDPGDVSSLGYAAWCVAAAADNRQPHRAKANPGDGS